MKTYRSYVPLLALGTSLLLVLAATQVDARKLASPPYNKTSNDRVDPPDLGPAIKVKLYEWGVESLNWDGSPSKEPDIPKGYYGPSQVPQTAPPTVAPEEPAPPRRPGPLREKPVIYFETDKDLKLEVQVKFSHGNLTWMYPKPTTMVSKSTVIWRDLWVYADSNAPARTLELPGLLDVPADHWANYSRDGSTSSLAINGEHERFLFYEGNNTDLPDVDVFKNAEGKYVIRNFLAHPIYSIRLNTPDGLIQAGTIAAASGDTPGELVAESPRDIKNAAEPADRVRLDALAAEVERAGLTRKQAEVFARCWRNELISSPVGSLSYRRDPRTLDGQMTISVTCVGNNIELTPHRVGYVFVRGIDFSLQAKHDTDALACANGDKTAGDRLGGLGMAGVGALRRAMLSKDMTLRQRLALAAALRKIRKD